MNKNKKSSPIKYLPAIIACVLIVAFYICITVCVLYAPVFPDWAIVLLYVTPFVVGIIWALVERILEIKGGEEDDAKKY